MLSYKNSTKSMEEDNFALPPEIKLQNFDSFLERPNLFKGMSELQQENKHDNFMDIFNDDKSFENRMEGECMEWQHDLNVFSSSFALRDDIMGESQGYGSAEIVTNCKMLEASIALDELLLKSRQISRTGNSN